MANTLSTSGHDEKLASPDTPSLSPQRHQWFLGMERRYWLAIFFIGPAALVIVGALVYPLAYNLWMSLHRFNMTQLYLGRDFIALQNYIDVLQDGALWNAFGNSLIVTLGGLALELPIGMALALALHRKIRGMATFRFIFLLPLLLVPAVVANMWRFLFQFDGVINYLLGWVGYGPFDWSSTALGLTSIVIVVTWQNAPFAFIVFLAGLQSIDPDLQEAAKVDGAGAWRRFRHIILPLMKPFILVVLTIRTMDLLRLFDEGFVLTGGGPGRSTEMLSQLVYTNSFSFFDIGRGSALSLVQTAIIIGFLIFFFAVLRPEGTLHGRR